MVMVEPAFFALTSTPSIAPSSAEVTRPASAAGFPWEKTLPENTRQKTAKLALRMGDSYLRFSFCTRQLSSSATYNTFSDGHAISWIQPNCLSCLPDSPSQPRTLPSSEIL